MLSLPQSIYLKQVGLIVYMAQVGCFVPATCAYIGLTDRILTRIASLESVSLQQSTFTIDAGQIAQMCKQCSPRSLLLVDEFGKGTSLVDGVALLSAFIEHLSEFKQGDGLPPPRTVITTHLLEVFEHKLLAAPPPAARGSLLPFVCAFHMAVLDDPNDESLVPLFQLEPGERSASSHALHCAKKAGVDEDTILRATQVGAAIRTKSQLGLLELDRDGDGSAENARLLAHRALRLFKSMAATEESGGGAGSAAQLRELMAALAQMPAMS